MPGLETELNLYDNINTWAVRWLIWNAEDKKINLGIKQFNRHNKMHLWLLYMMNSYSIARGYETIYINCSFWSYLWLKYIKGLKQVQRWRIGDKALLIEPLTFAKELCKGFNEAPQITEKIYDTYWR